MRKKIASQEKADAKANLKLNKTKLKDALKEQKTLQKTLDLTESEKDEAKAYGQARAKILASTDTEAQKKEALLALETTNKHLSEEQLLLAESEQQVEKQKLAVATNESTIKSTDLVIEEATTAEETLQTAEGEAQVLAAGAETTQDVIDLGVEKGKTKEKKKGILASMKQLAIDTADTVVSIAKAVASVIGIPAAIAAAALLATVGVGVGVSVGAVNKRKETQESISNNQNTIYENKQNSKKIKDLRDEYQTLLDLKDGGLASKENIDRMKEIEQELYEINSNITSTGQNLLNSVDEVTKTLDEGTRNKIQENEGNVKKLATDATAGQV